MTERNIVKSITKSDEPGKLEVWYAASLPNEIRFYLNDTQYLVAYEDNKGECLISLGEETEEIEEETVQIKSRLSILGYISVLYLINIIDTIFILLIVMNFILFIFDFVYVVLDETSTDQNLKSKHSAEHMMANFLEINRRLPKNIEEVKKSSRFSPECGSRELITGITEKFIQRVIATAFVTVIIILTPFSFNSITSVIAFIATYYFIEFFVGKVIIKYEWFNFITEPIKKVLTNIVQLANTTSKVKDKDIILAYFVAKQWLQVVYPEFYNENEDIFWKKS